MRSRQGRRAALAPALALTCIVALTAPYTAARLLAEGLAPAPAPAVGVAGTQSMDALGLPGLPDIKSLFHLPPLPDFLHKGDQGPPDQGVVVQSAPEQSGNGGSVNINGKDNCNGDKACQGLAQGGGGNGNNNAGHGGGGGGGSNNGGSANINGNDNCNGYMSCTGWGNGGGGNDNNNYWKGGDKWNQGWDTSKWDNKGWDNSKWDNKGGNGPWQNNQNTYNGQNGHTPWNKGGWNGGDDHGKDDHGKDKGWNGNGGDWSGGGGDWNGGGGDWNGGGNNWSGSGDGHGKDGGGPPNPVKSFLDKAQQMITSFAHIVPGGLPPFLPGGGGPPDGPPGGPQPPYGDGGGIRPLAAVVPFSLQPLAAANASADNATVTGLADSMLANLKAGNSTGVAASLSSSLNPAGEARPVLPGPGQTLNLASTFAAAAAKATAVQPDLAPQVGTSFATGLDGALDPCIKALQPGADGRLCCPIVAQTLTDTAAVANTTGVAVVFTQALAGFPRVAACRDPPARAAVGPAAPATAPPAAATAVSG